MECCRRLPNLIRNRPRLDLAPSRCVGNVEEKMNNVVAVIQARLGSHRLPEKVLLPLGKKSVLEHVVSRVARAWSIDKIVVAIPDSAQDKPLRQWCHEHWINFILGPEEDVLTRYAIAARQTGAKQIVRITSDCPCIDPRLIDNVVTAHIIAGSDYSSNVLTRTYPRGFDVEIVSAAALFRAEAEARNQYEREHVTPYFYQHPKRFRLKSVTAENFSGDPDWRLCIDTPDDYLMLCELWEKYHDTRGDFPSAQEIINCLSYHPEILQINAHVCQKPLTDLEQTPLRMSL
jgi:spore coat polysaccharide biosynthesis protein SpsF